MKVDFGGWVFEVAIGEAGDLLFTVHHPVDGENPSIAVAVDRQLVVTHDSLWEDADLAAEEALVLDDAVETIRNKEVETIRETLRLARTSASAAQHLLRTLQGFRYETRRNFGETSFWTRNGVACYAPYPVPHALAVAIVERLINEAMGTA